MNPSSRISYGSLQQNSPYNMNLQLPFIWEVLYQKDLEICVKINSAEQSHSITFSCLLPPGANGTRIKISITSKDDLFFLYTVEINKDKLHNLNNQHHLKLENLQDFLDMFRDLVEQIQKHTKRAYLKFSNQNLLSLQISTVINQKQFLILTLLGQKESHETIQSWVAFKYGEMRDQIKTQEHKISQLRQLIRLKNPYLLTYTNKIGH